MPSPLAEAFLMGILNGCYETPSNNFVGKISLNLSNYPPHSLICVNYKLMQYKYVMYFNTPVGYE